MHSTLQVGLVVLHVLLHATTVVKWVILPESVDPRLRLMIALPPHCIIPLCSHAATFPKNLSHAATYITVNGHSLKALIDSCSSDSFISEKVTHKLKLTVVPASKEISMASASLNTSSPGYVTVDWVMLIKITHVFS